MKVLFRCGHEGQVREGKAPQCVCGERRIARAFAPAPRIVGTASGPHVTTVALEPSAASFVPADVAPLKLKPVPVEAES